MSFQNFQSEIKADVEWKHKPDDQWQVEPLSFYSKEDTLRDANTITGDAFSAIIGDAFSQMEIQNDK